MEREEQGRASEHIGLGWINQSKENQRRAEWVYKREVRILDWIVSDESKQIGSEQEDQTQTEQSG